MLNKSNQEVKSAQTKADNSNPAKKRFGARKSKLNSILNRTLSDSVLNKKSNSFSYPTHHHKREFCLSRKNSTNRRSILHNPCSTSYNNTGSVPPQSPSFLHTQSPNTNIFNFNNYRNKLKYHRSSWCVLNNSIFNNVNINNNPVNQNQNLDQSNNIINSNNNNNQLNENASCSLSSSVGSSLSPSPITILNQNNILLSTPQQNINNFSNKTSTIQPLSSPKLQLTPANSISYTQKTLIQTPNQTNVNLSLSNKNIDTRRWSFASIHSTSSSGYGGGTNTPPIVNSLPPSFQQQQINSSSTKSENVYSSNEKILNKQNQLESQNEIIDNNHKQQNEENVTNFTKRLSIRGRRSRLSSSNESSHLDDSSEAGFSSPISYRQRARSLSCSPTKGHNESDIIMVQNEKFKEKFPKACKQLEENLQIFIDVNKTDLATSSSLNNLQSQADSNQTTHSNSNHAQINNKENKYHVPQPTSLDPAARFIHNQVIEIAKLCLEKSKSNQLTSSYFDEMTSSLEKLLLEARDKCCQVELSVEYLHKFIKKFLFIISHVARLLECIEFDPLEFSYLLDCAEQQAKQQEIKTDIPKYIISKLGIDRDPIKELNQNNEDDLSSDDTNKNESSFIRTNSMISSISTISTSDQDYLTDPSVANSTKTESNQQHIVPPCEDDFEEIKLISNGAYGAVYLVRHKQIGERFAMKKIKKQNIILRNQLQQVFTERDIMTFTDNPFVVALICTFETKKHLCMVMEYVEGGDVATLIKNMGPLPLDMGRIYFAETTLAVEYLHNYGIIHRDLKPDNLLITSLGHIKLTDFGLSKIGLMNLTTNFYEENYDSFMKDLYCKEFNDKQICGTPQYLAPEVILRQGYGKTVDWWSMGIILYEFLTSMAPFNGKTPEDLFSNVINGEILWPEDDDEVIHIPDDAKNLIMGLLTHDPLKRLGAGGAIEIKQHPFFDYLDWNNLLRIKADFVPQLDGPDDTSYFDTRSERYNHESDSNPSNLIQQSSCLSLPIEQQILTKAESFLSLNHQQNEDKVLNELLNKKLNLTETNNDDALNNDLLLNDDTDNELFASFSSCSSKFRLSSISNNNSPVLFMNESNNGSRLNIDSGSSLSINSIVKPTPTTSTTLSTNSNPNSTASEKTNENENNKSEKVAEKPAILNLSSDLNSNLNKENISKPSNNDNIKDSTSSSSSTSTTTTTNTILDSFNKSSQLDSQINLISNSLSKIDSSLIGAIKLETNSSDSAKSGNSTPSMTPTTPTSINNKNKLNQNNQNLNKSFNTQNQQQQQNNNTWFKSSTRHSFHQNQNKQKFRYQQAENNINPYYQTNQVYQHQHHPNHQNYHHNSHNKLNRWPSSITASESTTSPSIYNSNTSLNKLNHNVSFTPNNHNSIFKRPSFNDSKKFNHSSSNSRLNIIPSQFNNQYNQLQYEQLPLQEMINIGSRNQKIVIKKSSRGYGFAVRAIKVYYGDSDFYTIQHLVIQIDQQGPAYSAGLKINDIITHVNDQIVCGKVHHEILKLMMSSSNNTLYLNTVQLNQVNIKTGGRKRSPSKSKFARPFTNPSQTFYNNPNQQQGYYNKQNYNSYYFNSNLYQNYNPVFVNQPFLSSNSSTTTNSSTSSLVSSSSSSRRSFGTSNDYNSHNIYNNYNHNLLQPAFHQLHFNNNNNNNNNANIQIFVPPAQPVVAQQQQQQQERKKKSCLFRKLSEKYANAHKHELQQQQLQLLQQSQIPHSSSSSSSSSSLNNSFNNNLKNICGNLSPKLNPNMLNNNSNSMINSAIDTANSRRNMSASELYLSTLNNNENGNMNVKHANSIGKNYSNYTQSTSNSPLNSYPNSPASNSSLKLINEFNYANRINNQNRPHSMISIDYYSGYDQEQDQNKKSSMINISQNVNTTRGSTALSNNSLMIDDLSYTNENDNTITAGNSFLLSNTNQAPMTNSKIIQNLFDPNHHFQSINPAQLTDTTITQTNKKPEPLFSQVVSQGSQALNEQMTTVPENQESSKNKAINNTKNSKPSLISSLKSSFISKNSNSKLHLSPFSNIKSQKNNQKQSKDKKLNDKQQQQQQQQQQKTQDNKKAQQVHSPSPLATSDGLVITYGKSASVQTSLISTGQQITQSLNNHEPFN